MTNIQSTAQTPLCAFQVPICYLPRHNHYECCCLLPFQVFPRLPHLHVQKLDTLCDLGLLGKCYSTAHLKPETFPRSTVFGVFKRKISYRKSTTNPITTAIDGQHLFPFLCHKECQHPGLATVTTSCTCITCLWLCPHSYAVTGIDSWKTYTALYNH